MGAGWKEGSERGWQVGTQNKTTTKQNALKIFFTQSKLSLCTFLLYLHSHLLVYAYIYSCTYTYTYVYDAALFWQMANDLFLSWPN